MIQDKLRFSDDCFLIEKKCLCCKKFSHRFAFCPKLHYIPDKERIIKREIFSSAIFSRSSFLRRAKKANGLKNQRINDFAAKKYTLILEIPNVNVIADANLERFTNLNTFQDNDSQESEEKKEVREEFNRIIKNMKREEEENENNLKINYEKKLSSHYNTLEFGLKQLNSSSSLFNKSKSFLEDITSDLQEKTNDYKSDNNHGKQNLKLDILYFFFEKVHNYKNYYPESNIESIVKKQLKLKRIYRECNKNGILEKYKNLKFYSFYSNSLNEVLLKESKARFKHNNMKDHRSIDNNLGLQKREKRDSNINDNDSKRIRLSPLRKTYFDIPKRTDTKTSIQELILMIKKKMLIKKKQNLNNFLIFLPNEKLFILNF